MLHTMVGQGLAIGAETSDDAQAQSLIRRMATGDRRAMDQFYGRFQENVYRFALSRLNDPAAASDVLNETMLKVWQEAERFRGEARVLTWVLGICFHKTMDQMRSRYRHEGSELDPAMPDESEVEMSQVLSRMEDIGRVQEAVTRLSPVQRSVLHLAFYEDLPYAEIARVLECPEATVKTRVFHAKRALKSLLVQP